MNYGKKSMIERFGKLYKEIDEIKAKNKRPLKKSEYNKIVNSCFGPATKDIFYMAEKLRMDLHNMESSKKLALSEIDNLSCLKEAFPGKTLPSNKKEEEFFDKSIIKIIKSNLNVWEEDNFNDYIDSVEYKIMIKELIDFLKEKEYKEDFISYLEDVYNEKTALYNKSYNIKDIDELLRLLELNAIPGNLSNINIRAHEINKIKDISNLHLKIYLRNYDVKCYNLDRLVAIKKINYIDLTNACLKGNDIIGDLLPLKLFIKTSKVHLIKKIYFFYNEDTFDEKYKKEHPEFFLSNDAPDELKEMYYNPKEIEINGKTYLIRKELTLENFIKYYKYLKDKSLENFNIKEETKAIIRLIKLFGLDYTVNIIKSLASFKLPISKVIPILNDMTDVELEYYFLNLDDETLIENDKFCEKIISKIKK